MIMADDNRGFASMADDVVSSIASQGGKSSKRGKSSNSGRKGGQAGNSKRGFASMPKDQVSAIASKGGRAAHEKGTAHEWNSQEAAEAGRKGGSK